MAELIPSKNRRVLIVDDVRAIHDDFRKILCTNDSVAASLRAQEAALFDEALPQAVEEQFEVDSALQGEEGLVLLQKAAEKKQPYAVAFVDVRMPPGWDGVETAQRLWSVDPDLQVVICTAHTDYSWEAMVRKLGQSDRLLILKKPFDTVEVRQLACALSHKWDLACQARLKVDDLQHMVTEQTAQLKQVNDQLQAQITEDARIKRDLQLANDRIQENHAQLVQSEKLASLGQLAAGVAHEINNPVGFVMSNLGTLNGYVGVFRGLLAEYQKAAQACAAGNNAEAQSAFQKIAAIEVKEDLTYVLQDVNSLLSESADGMQRIKEIVQGLKSFARLDEATVKDANLNEGIEATLKVIWNELKYKCEVKKNLGPLPVLRCHPGQLNQVFMNLLVNSAQAIKERGTITVSTEATDSQIVIRIADTGQGIAPEHLPKLFTPFFTTKPVGKGTGLGLSVSYGVVKKHNGTIEVDSKVGQGTTFIIKLPLTGVAHE